MSHVSVNMMCSTCHVLWPCLPKKEEVIEMLIGVAGLRASFVDVTTVPEEVKVAWKAYTNAIVRNYKIVNANGEWRMELLSATEKGQVPQNDQSEYPNGNEVGQTAKAGRCDCIGCSR